MKPIIRNILAAGKDPRKGLPVTQISNKLMKDFRELVGRVGVDRFGSFLEREGWEKKVSGGKETYSKGESVFTIENNVIGATQ